MGAVKSRLAAGAGQVVATSFYRNELARTLRALGPDPRWRTWLAVTPDTAAGAPLWPRHVAVTGQGRGDLGARMHRIMRTLPPGPAVIVGSDIPGLVAGDVASAFRLLGGNDAVFGPAVDGGFYLVGFRRTPKVPDAFGGVRWSGPLALADTLANLEGRRVAFTRRLADVDTAEDLRALRTNRQPAAAPCDAERRKGR